MKISLVTYETTRILRVHGYIGGNNYLSPIRKIQDEELDDAEFLCFTHGGRTFVSPIMFTPEFGQYVDDIKGKVCILISELKELYLIEASEP